MRGLLSIGPWALLLATACGGSPAEGTTSDTDSDGTDGSSSTTSGGSGCVPGRQVECACPDGSKGAQVCAEDGQSFGPCDCAGASAGSSGASGGSGSASSGTDGQTGGGSTSGGASGSTGGGTSTTGGGSTGGDSNTGGTITITGGTITTSGGSGGGLCDLLIDPYSCTATPGCIWDEQLGECIPG